MLEQLLCTIGPTPPRTIEQFTWGVDRTFGAAGLQSFGAVYNGKYYLFGGRVGISASARDTSWVYDGTTLTQLANMPAALLGANAVVVGSKILIFGGTVALVNGYENANMYWYDPATNTYSTDGTTPFRSILGGAALVGDYVYAYGGLVNTAESGFPKQFYRYSLTTKTWESLPYHSGPAIYSTQLHAFGTKIYTYGGEVNSSGGRDTTMYVYDTVAGTWSTEAPNNTPPTGRSISSCIYGDGIYICGGRLANNALAADAYWYNRATKNWVKCKNFLAVVAFQTLLNKDNKIVSFDGWGGSSTVYSGIYSLR